MQVPFFSLVRMFWLMTAPIYRAATNRHFMFVSSFCFYSTPARKVSPFTDDRVQTSNHKVMEDLNPGLRFQSPHGFLLPITSKANETGVGGIS